MTLQSLLQKESVVPHRNILGMALVAGIANVAILALINSAAGRSVQDGTSTKLMLLFLVAIATFNVSQRYLFNKTAVVFESIVDKLRRRILDKIRSTDLISLEQLGHAEVYAKLTQNTTVISQAAGVMAASLQSALMVIFSVLYIATISMPAFLITVGMIAGGCILYLRNEKNIIGYISQANRTEVKFFRSVTNILDGFKETKVSVRRSRTVAQSAKDLSRETKNLKITASQMYSKNYVFAQNFFYVLIAILIFLLPRLVPTYADSITEVAATILFIIGPLSTVVSGIPAYTNADIAVREISQLESMLDSAGGEEVIEEDIDPIVDEFSELSVDELSFSYLDRNGRPLFTVGPINFTLKRSEVVFIIGGNGSGKSTFIKALLGLYHPDGGKISVNGIDVDADNVQSYRELFSTILSDFHLFDRLYGIDTPEAARMKELIETMGLKGKTDYANGEFTNLELSTGQKKRLAMIVSLLEDRPIFIFDEWAAEQDPEFRKYFYEVILNDLRERGKGVIAISHDDHYFERADRIIKLDYGKTVPA